ncbi:MAG: hypothetical protein HQL19_06055, partial [Candidatus Omnitrophica bacterium]|nr:hypothetical protein [Candidatus Omnitrophota bacterium]
MRATHRVAPTHELTKNILREIVIPILEKEVNEGQNFLRLRQVYASLILAKWYKQNLRQSILNREYSDQKKIAGVDMGDTTAREKIYARYLEAY